MISWATKLAKFNFTNMDKLYFSDPNRNAVVFSATNTTWTYKQIDNHSKAFANGLTHLNFIAGDSILVRLPRENMQQKFIIKIAAANKNTSVFISQANTQKQLQKQLHDTKARSFVFDSYSKIGNTTIIDTLYRLAPEIARQPHNQEIIPRDFKFLRSLIQTDNYRFAGAFSFQSILKYKLQTDYDLSFECEEKPIRLASSPNQQKENPIVITQPCAQLAFKAGILNCLTNGKLLICVRPQQVKHVSEKFNHEIDVICTEPMAQLHNINRVFVASTSPLYANHPQRFSITL